MIACVVPARARTHLLDDIVDASGRPLSAERLTGKPVLIVAWASWSPFCGPALDAAERLQRRFASAGLVTIAVATDRDIAAARAAFGSRRIPLARGGRGFIRALNISDLPQIAVISRQGALLAQFGRFSIEQESAIAAVVADAASRTKSVVPGASR